MYDNIDHWNPVSVELGGDRNFRGCALSPYLDQKEVPGLIEFLTKGASKRKKTRVAFVDLVLTEQVYNLICLLQILKVEVYFFDHHMDKRIRERLNSFDHDKNLSKIQPIITSRDQVKSCTDMLYSGELVDKGINAVCFHADGDGILSSLYGFGLVDVYPEMVKDSIIMDHGSQDNSKLSKTGSIVLNTLYGKLTHPLANPHLYREQLKTELPKLIEAICYPELQSSKDYFRRSTGFANWGIRNLRGIIRKKLELLPGSVAYLDIRKEIIKGQVINLGTITKMVRQKQQRTMIYCYTDIRLYGGEVRNVVNIRMDYRCKNMDLRHYLPEKYFSSNESFSNRLVVLQEDWNEFLQNWQEDQKSLKK